MRPGQRSREVAAGKAAIWRKAERTTGTWTEKEGWVRWRERWLKEQDEWTAREGWGDWVKSTQWIAKVGRGIVEVAKGMRQWWVTVRHWWDVTRLCNSIAATKRKTLVYAGAQATRRALPSQEGKKGLATERQRPRTDAATFQ